MTSLAIDLHQKGFNPPMMVASGLEEGSWSDADFRGYLFRSNFKGSLWRVDLRGIDFTEVGDHIDVKGCFYDCDMRDCNFSGGAILSPALFQDCDLRGARFDHTIVGSVAFEQCRLDRGVFSTVRLINDAFVDDIHIQEWREGYA